MITVLFLYRPVAWCFLRGMKVLSILMVGVALLLGGCGEEDTQKKPLRISITEDTQEKPLLIVSPEDLTEVGGITYLPQKDGTSKPYTGWGVEKDGAVKLSEIFYKNGKKHGTEIWYNKDGSKSWEIPYVNGEPHGTGILYREDGSKFSEVVWENGKEISEKYF